MPKGYGAREGDAEHEERAPPRGGARVAALLEALQGGLDHGVLLVATQELAARAVRLVSNDV